MKMNRKITVLIISFCLILSSTLTYADTDGLYYSSKMVKNATFVWNVTISQNYFEEIPEGANFSVTLKDDLYPGPMSEEDLSSVYAEIAVDGSKYTGEGFPLFWHLYEIDSGVNTSIRERFEEESTLFNVTDGSMGRFNVNFTILESQYTLFVEMEIDPSDGLTKRYYEHFTDNSEIDSTIELNFIDYYIEIPIETSTSPSDDGPKTIDSSGIIIAFISIVSLGIIVSRHKRFLK